MQVDGEVQTPHTLGFIDLAGLPDQVADIGAFISGRAGSGVRLRTLLDTVGVEARATHITFTATDDQFSASVPLTAVVDRAILVYRQGLEPLAATQGGPVRLYITDVASCDSDAVSACTNVKHLDHIRLTVEPA